MTLLAIRNLLKVLIDEPTTAKWSNANLNHLIFSKYRDITAKITRRNADYYVTTGTVSTTANNEFTTLPATCTILKKLTDSEGNTLHWVPNSQFDHTAAAGTPTCFDVNGRKIWWGTTPDAIIAYTAYYHYMPTDLALDGDVPELPPNFHDILAYGVAVESRICKEDKIDEYAMIYNDKLDGLLHQVSISQTNNAKRVKRVYNADEQ
jgi:hypothetical protein